MRCACLPTQQRADHHPAIHGYESSPDLCPIPPIRLRSIWEGCSPWCPPIRSDGSRGRLLGCRVPSVWVVWYGLIVARMGRTPRGLPSSPASLPHRLRGRSTSPRRGSAPASAQSAHQSCNGRIFARGSHRRRSTQHMP